MKEIINNQIIKRNNKDGKSTENTRPIDKIEEFKKIKTPEELLSFMKENIKYGFIGKTDKKIYSHQIEDWGEGEQPEQKLQDAKELFKSGHGTCWEQTEMERQWFGKNNFEFKTMLLMFGEDISQKNPAHTLLIFKKNGKWCWFENTLNNHNGIHEFDNMNSLIGHVKKILTNNALNSGATEDDIKKFKFHEYDESAYSDSADEFISNIIDNNPPLILEK